MVNFGFGIVTFIVSDTASSLGLSNLLEQKGMVPFFDSSNVMHVMRLQGLNVRGIGTAAIFGDDHLEMGVILTKVADEALGRVAFTIIFGRPILLDNRLRH